ncbi:hypothetical protein AGMMS50239_26840 [Bacteroidia bacterium]|nr:hypothetical protein AGMMS50239_26840 [Bacteroidia bacterium]
MIQETIVREFVDYILLNADITKATGLYNGKAGLSLSLFEVSRCLRDEKIEDKAFNLLQEVLIIKNKDDNFENGLAGIGYTLLYLIENKLLEADFDEIFGEQYEALIKNLENIEKEPLRLVNSLRIIYFLSKVGNIKREDDRLPKIIKKYLKDWNYF